MKFIRYTRSGTSRIGLVEERDVDRLSVLLLHRPLLDLDAEDGAVDQPVRFLHLHLGAAELVEQLGHRRVGRDVDLEAAQRLYRATEERDGPTGAEDP